MIPNLPFLQQLKKIIGWEELDIYPTEFQDVSWLNRRRIVRQGNTAVFELTVNRYRGGELYSTIRGRYWVDTKQYNYRILHAVTRNRQGRILEIAQNTPLEPIEGMSLLRAAIERLEQQEQKT